MRGRIQGYTVSARPGQAVSKVGNKSLSQSLSQSVNRMIDLKLSLWLCSLASDDNEASKNRDSRFIWLNNRVTEREERTIDVMCSRIDPDHYERTTTRSWIDCKRAMVTNEASKQEKMQKLCMYSSKQASERDKIIVRIKQPNERRSDQCRHL